MNNLFIGPYRQNDGWGFAASDYIKAIKTQVDNLAARPLFYVNNKANQIDEAVLDCENKVFNSYDRVFQLCLPHSLTIDKTIKKNIGMVMLETNNMSKSTSIHNMNGMDEILVPSKQEAKCLKSSGVTTPIKVISQPLDIEFYKKNIEQKIKFNPMIDNSFKFYTVAEFVERKNLFDLITAFNLAFSHTDNVSLIIKTNVDHNTLLEKINKFKQKLNIRKQHKQEIIIPDRLSKTDMVGLHNSCDCFVMPSLGESFCRPAAEALILGKTPIVTDNTGMVDFVDNKNGYVVHSKKQPVIMDQRTLSDNFDIYTANEYWYKPNVYHLIECMQDIYNMYKKDRKSYEAKRQIGLDSIEQFSYDNIGKNICS